MKKIHIIFITLIILEFASLLIIDNFYYNNCGSPCDTKSLMHPFGRENSGNLCIAVCVPHAPTPLFFIVSDIFIITVIIYAFYLLFLLIKRLRKNEK